MKVIYFAWLRERLNRSEETVSPPDNVRTIDQFMDWLCDRDEAIRLAFSNRKLIRTALDEKIVDRDTPLGTASTVAFFPPMTGG